MSFEIETPLIESQALSRKSGHSIWLKMEALQPCGSFKMRGMGHACQEYARRGARRFICSSGGNAGLAVAYAGRKLSVPVMVVVPETTSERAKELIRQEGAEVVVHGRVWNDSNAYALAQVQATDAYLHPFDDPLIWRGHAGMMDEIARSGLKPDLVVLSVGGGGLLCGVVEGLERNGWHDTPVAAVETLGADSYAQALQAGRPVKLPAITSIATTLGAAQVCDQAVEWSRCHPIESLTVSDRSAVAACRAFLDDHRLLVEPACGAALAAVYEQAPVLSGRTTVLVIVCGGAGATLEQLRAWEAAVAD
jgi:L-serine/L-threonine ammonia-lyase